MIKFIKLWVKFAVLIPIGPFTPEGFSIIWIHPRPLYLTLLVMLQWILLVCTWPVSAPLLALVQCVTDRALAKAKSEFDNQAKELNRKTEQ